MRRPASISVTLIAFLSVAHGADAPVPVAWPADRYSAMSAKSPFALATLVVPVAEPQASFATNWFISGIGRIGDEDFVTIKARDISTQFSLYGNEPNAANGVSLASIDWSDAVGKSTVVLRKGNETAKLEFNEAEIHNAPPSANKPTTPVAGQRPAGTNGPLAASGTPKVPPFSPSPALGAPGQRRPVTMPALPVAPAKRPNAIPNTGPPQTQHRIVPIPVQQ